MARVTDTDLANAEVELSQAKLYSANGSEMRDANEGSVPMTNLGAHGLNVAEAPVEAGYVNPSLLRVVYHAYDGRTVAIPDYMAKVRLAERFPTESWIPAKFWGKRVWFLEPQTVDNAPMQLKCLLHGEQEEMVRNEVARAGIAPSLCRKSNIPSVYAVEQHMELKHKNEWKIIQRHRGDIVNNEYRESQRLQTEAFIRLAEALSSKEGNGTTS